MCDVRRPVVFYDGGCPVCRREIGHYRRLDRTNAIEWRDVFAEPDALDGSGVDWHTAMQRFHARDENGTLRSGVDAFAMVWEHLPFWRWLARVVRGLRLTRPLDAVYRWYARRRYARRCAGQCDPGA